MEEKEIGFILVISREGQFLRFEDCRIDNKKHAKTFFVKKHESRSSAPVANYLYDNGTYVLGYSDKENEEEKCKRCFEKFRDNVQFIAGVFPSDPSLKALSSFYRQTREDILAAVSGDPLWEDIKKNLSKKYSTFSFRIEGDTKILPEKREILQLGKDELSDTNGKICLITGKKAPNVDITTATMIPGSQATAKLVAFQTKSGYDSYGKEKCGNAPISKEAEFAYTTALNTMLGKDSRNKFMVGNRTFVFWSSSSNEVGKQAEECLFDLLGVNSSDADDPNMRIGQVRKVFTSIYSGDLRTKLDDKFYILGLAPNSARIAVVYWSETSLKDFAGMILKHFDDMEIIDTCPKKMPYKGVKGMLRETLRLTPGVKVNDADVTPNLPEAVIKSIFQGFPYPYTLFSSCIRRLRAESGEKGGVRIGRIAILKAYLNRLNDNNNKKIQVMLDKENTNQGYLCGRLFAVLDKIQEDANHINSIRERYMNAASSTPASVFATILNLSAHHSENLPKEGSKVFYEKIKQEIISKISADGFPTHLDLQDQGRFFVGYYHQRQELFTKQEDNNK